jgi:hypothetical protein
MTNESFSDHGGWNSSNLLENNVVFVICLIAIIFHFSIWFQLFIHKTKFDLTFLFPLSYMSTDIFMVLCYFIQYSIRIRSWIPVTPLSCYFEAYSIFYFNLFELYSLTALNICRYWQIVRNRNIYTFHRRKLIISSIIVPLLVLINLIIQDILGWCIVNEKLGSSCTLSYTNIIVRIWNMIILLTIPTLISFSMLSLAVCYLRNKNAEQLVMRRNHHRRLILHSFIFYSVWLSLWSPLMIITYLDIDTLKESIEFVAVIANTLETFIDPFICVFLDNRFAQAWKKSYIWIKHQLEFPRNARVHPTFQVATTHQINTLNHIHK